MLCIFSMGLCGKINIAISTNFSTLSPMETVWSIIVLLLIASLVHQWAKSIKIPYTILLFVVWAVLALIMHQSWFSTNIGLHFTPELLFFVFLPVLIFESWYKIKYHYLSKDYVAIRSLAILWVIISTAVVWVWSWALVNALWFQIPLIVMLLFGVIISATDPVAVLAIFKHMWVPKRLRLLFEGESLFNDWTSIAVFLILLEIAQQPVFTTATLLQWVGTFVMMVVWWMILWVLCGVIFSYLVKTIKNNEFAEITLVMVLAHITFFLAEYISHTTHWSWFHLQLSWVIATAYAALIMGNFWKTKITPKVEEYLEKFWDFFAFVCNALVFLLMGLMIWNISIPIASIWPVLLVCIVVVVIARAASVYSSLWVVNLFNLCRNIPIQRQHLMARGSLRGAISLVMVLLLPATLPIENRPFDYYPQELILTMVVTLIIFSLIVKWLTVKPITKKMNIDKLYDLEEFEKYESEVLVYSKIIEKIEDMKEHYHIADKSYEQLIEKYQSKIQESQLKMELFLKQDPDPEWLIFRALSLHALGIERQYLKEMFTYNEIPENLYHYMHWKITQQVARVRQNKQQIRGFDKPTECKKTGFDPIMWLISLLERTNYTTNESYIIHRTRLIVTSKVIEALESFWTLDFWYDKQQTQPIITLYKKFNQRARESLWEVEDIESILLNKWLAKTEEHVIADLLAKDMITEKLYQKFTKEIEEEVLRSY